MFNAPNFRGTRNLKFTREEIAAIREAEGALGYPRPRWHQAPAPHPIHLANLLAVLFPVLGEVLDSAAHAVDGFVRVILFASGVMVLGIVIIALVSRSTSDSQAQAPSAQIEVQTPSPRGTAPAVPPP